LERNYSSAFAAVPYAPPQREKNEDNDAGSVSAALFQPYFVPEQKRFRRRTLARENYCKRLIRSKSRGNSFPIIHQLARRVGLLP
jgi:hypothetical protein